MQLIDKSPVGFTDVDYSTAGLSSTVFGLPNRTQVIKQAETAIAVGAGLVAFGLVALLVLNRT